MKRGWLLLLLVLCLLISACARDDGFDAGEALTAEEISALREQLLEEANAQRPIPSEGIFYFTQSGSVYHVNPDCSYLTNAKTLLWGTLEEVQARGLRACSRCAQEKNGGGSESGEGAGDGKA